MSDRQKRFEELMNAISKMDAGTLQIQVYKGMPVKIRLVSNEFVLGGENVLDLNTIEAFSPREWWKQKT